MRNWLRSLFPKKLPETNEPLPQLEMVRDDLDDLLPISVPENYELRTYRDGDEQAWCNIMEGNVGQYWTVDRCHDRLIDDPRFTADNLFFATYWGTPVASACAWQTDVEELTIGEIHMVAAMKSHRGKGLGHLVNAAVLHRLRNLGFKKAHLKTDDWRLAAIQSYFKAGLHPLHTHISHAERWEAIVDQLSQRS